jgi:hypothetical protein
VAALSYADTVSASLKRLLRSGPGPRRPGEPAAAMDIGGSPHVRHISEPQVSAAQSNRLPQSTCNLEEPLVGARLRQTPTRRFRKWSDMFCQF